MCEGETSRLEVTKEILRILGKENEIQVQEVNSEFFKKEYFAARPVSEKLINVKLNLRKLNIMRDWKVCLHEYMSNYYGDYLNNK